MILCTVDWTVVLLVARSDYILKKTAAKPAKIKTDQNKLGKLQAIWLCGKGPHGVSVHEQRSILLAACGEAAIGCASHLQQPRHHAPVLFLECLFMRIRVHAIAAVSPPGSQLASPQRHWLDEQLNNSSLVVKGKSVSSLQCWSISSRYNQWNCVQQRWSVTTDPSHCLQCHLVLISCHLYLAVLLGGSMMPGLKGCA